jgi:hypothetical protein
VPAARPRQRRPRSATGGLPTDAPARSAGATPPAFAGAGSAELLTLQAEYVAWSNSLPDSVRDTATDEALQPIVDLDLADLAAIVPPCGYGRD